ncbi:MAG: hypothetical protein OES20_09385 [Gammaproteobacteria bacterium]|nr:hypothetical protein [Gammaproteobacteria bacterium]MDH3857323.1 hypothetical protein [Gammaproteobacteria bacterium]
MPDESNPVRAADNLLLNCAELNAGDSLLIVREDPRLGWYDAAVNDLITRAAIALGIKVEHLEVAAPQNIRNSEVAAAMRHHDCTLFLARIGDQDRFAIPVPGKKIVMCYIRTPTMLGSAFGQVSYAATLEMKQSLDALIRRARRVEISCPLGTECSYSHRPPEATALSDVSVLRFPLGVVTPIDATSAKGRVALSGYLTPTGSRVYQPPNLAIDVPVFANIQAGRIIEFEGPTGMVAAIEQHYANIAEQFAIDAKVVHSWHAGLHPGLSYDQSAAEDPDRWSNTVFNHPRVLHFHTCGNYAPGEICWIIKDPTVMLDNKPLWRDGLLQVLDFSETAECLEKWPELEQIYAEPSNQTGF